jgi:GT2 family glycosyltransferase
VTEITDQVDAVHPVAAAATTLTSAIVMASAGRPVLLEQVFANLKDQTQTDYAAVVSVPDEASLPQDIPANWSVVSGTRGLAAQRNAGLTAVDADIIFFFDDDAVVREDYVRNALAFFAAHPEVVGITGRVLLDGATTGEISPELSASALTESFATTLTGKWQRTRELYGCNFAYRASAAPELRFDARLPLYSWLEDHDFARRLKPFGVIAKVDDCVIVHRAAASGGRQSHARLGYSQFMNPVYLWRKGSFPLWLAIWEIFRPTSKNVLYSTVHRESEWRRQRLRGNLIAAFDVVRGRITPERITQM